jgi:putative peptide zinc metalloprotease protein
LIGDPDALEAVLVVEQADVEQIKTDQRVRVQLDQLPGQYLRGRVVEVARLDADAPPPELVAAGKLPVRTSTEGAHQLEGDFCLVRVDFEEPPNDILPGGVGRAKIRVSPASLGKRIIRYLGETFRFRL